MLSGIRKLSDGEITVFGVPHLTNFAKVSPNPTNPKPNHLNKQNTRKGVFIHNLAYASKTQ